MWGSFANIGLDSFAEKWSTLTWTNTNTHLCLYKYKHICVIRVGLLGEIEVSSAEKKGSFCRLSLFGTSIALCDGSECDPADPPAPPPCEWRWHCAIDFSATCRLYICISLSFLSLPFFPFSSMASSYLCIIWIRIYKPISVWALSYVTPLAFTRKLP